MIIAILGRQPALGLAELESLYTAAAVTPLGNQAAQVDAPIDPKRLGSVLKVATPLGDVPTTDWDTITRALIAALPGWLAELPEDGKLKLGISVYGLAATAQQLLRTGLELKKAARAAKRSMRIIPSTAPVLNSAQILHNGLTGELGMEIVLIKQGARTIIGRTTWVQDIDDYAKRDYGRPKRDAFVGMLPPKLAQTMLNMAQAQPGQHVVDPFCGTGVVLQEAALLGCAAYGTDLQEKMVRYTRDNLNWLKDTYHVDFDFYLEVADATTATWRPPVDTVVCETYLGQPLSGLPKPEKLSEIMRDCDTIITKFLRNLHGQLKPGSRHIIAVPAWHVGNTFKHLPLLDHLGELGYNRVRFQHAPEWSNLLYYREDQIVARELLVLTSK